MEIKEIEKTVIEEFSSEKVQVVYKEMTKQGLWKSEEMLFKKYFKKNSEVLDIGCGSGRTTYGLTKLGYKVIGIDITPEMIKSANELLGYFGMKVDFKILDAKDLKFKDSSFDNALFSFNGWDQIPGKENRLKSLKEIYRVLKPGGYYIFSSHIGRGGKYTLFWIKQWIKFYILRPFGLKIREKEYGDVFFKGSEVGYNNFQYISIPTLQEVLNMIKVAGFDLEYKEFRNTIAQQDETLKLSCNCMFFVCKKS